MDDKTYDVLCIISSITALVLLLLMRNKFTYSGIFILAAIFSFTWRIYRINTSANQNHLLFYLDLLFALLTIYYCFKSSEMSPLAISCIVTLMILSWILKFLGNVELSRIVHCLAHYLVVGYLLYCFIDYTT